MRPSVIRPLIFLLACMLCFSGIPTALADEPLTVLLIGVDSANEEMQGRSDAMLLARIDPQNGDVRLVSFLRDLYVRIPGQGKSRLNAAYYYGGEALLCQTLKENFGILPDRTITVNFPLLAELIDQMDGVELDITDEELPRLNDVLAAYNLSLGLSASHGKVQGSGLQLLGGKQALCFSRIRKLDSDFVRTGRQQKVLTAMLNKASQLDFFTLARLITANLGKLHTDLGLRDINRLLPLVVEKGALELRTAHVPFTGTCTDETIDGMQVLVPDLPANIRKLEQFLTEP